MGIDVQIFMKIQSKLKLKKKNTKNSINGHNDERFPSCLVNEGKNYDKRMHSFMGEELQLCLLLQKYNAWYHIKGFIVCFYLLLTLVTYLVDNLINFSSGISRKI